MRSATTERGSASPAIVPGPGCWPQALSNNASTKTPDEPFRVEPCMRVSQRPRFAVCIVHGMNADKDRLDGGEPVKRARELVPMLRDCADEAERDRHMPRRAAEAMERAGL